jgi:hypothetical protein
MPHLNFKNYFKTRIITEDVPVSGEYDTWYPSLRTGVSTRSQANDVYLFKDISDALNISVQDSVDHISQRLFDKLFPNNQPNPADSEDEFRENIFNALTDIIQDINRQAHTSIKNSKSQKNYTARIISTLGQTVKTFNGVQPRVARAAIQRVAREIIQEEPQEETTEQPLTDIEKLKIRLFKDGYGNGLELTSKLSKLLYNIKITGEVSLTDKLKLLKTATEKVNAAFLTGAWTRNQEKFIKINNFYGGVFKRVNVGLDIKKSNFWGNDEEDVQSIKRDVLRFNFTFEEAINNKLISTSGKKFIDHLVSKYNVIPSSVYRHFESMSGETGPVAFVCIPITTANNYTIYYTERQRTSKPASTSRRMLFSKDTVVSISRFLSVESRNNYNFRSIRNKFNLNQPNDV